MWGDCGHLVMRRNHNIYSGLDPLVWLWFNAPIFPQTLRTWLGGVRSPPAPGVSSPSQGGGRGRSGHNIWTGQGWTGPEFSTQAIMFQHSRALPLCNETIWQWRGLNMKLELTWWVGPTQAR